MSETAIPKSDRICIAVLALGGHGGGVLAEWIRRLAVSNGFIAQATSVTGVAQRTGTAVYYIELFRKRAAASGADTPVLALMPVPGDVDIVIASELMEVGRAILRGFVTKDRTTLIGSTHRVYAISEKTAMGDGRESSDRILDAARRRSARFLGFDMEAASNSAGSVISSVMFGALAGSGALPFSRDAFEQTIGEAGEIGFANSKGFSAGYDGVRHAIEHAETRELPPAPTTHAGRVLRDRVVEELPLHSQRFAIEGVRRLMDYQDAAYAKLYLDRLETVRGVDDGRRNYELTTLAARHLALWMSYEDTIRVADLKVRQARSTRIEGEVSLAKGQLLSVIEYMHPRLEEFCETLPAPLGAMILRNAVFRRMLTPLFAKGRHVKTTSLSGFLLLRLLASLRVVRRSTLRFNEEQRRIEEWLSAIRETAARDFDLAIEMVRMQVLLKGYGDTFERGLRNFDAIATQARRLFGRPDAADRIRTLRTAALADEEGHALRTALSG